MRVTESLKGPQKLVWLSTIMISLRGDKLGFGNESMTTPGSTTLKLLVLQFMFEEVTLSCTVVTTSADITPLLSMSMPRQKSIPMCTC